MLGVQDLKDHNILQYRSGHFKLRLAVSVLMLIIAFIGVVITNFSPTSAWSYWCITAIVYALLSVSLSFITKLKAQTPLNLVIREALHWLALIVVIYLVTLFMHFGVLSNVLAALFMLTLLTLATLLAGINFDSMYILIGIALGIFAIITVFFVQYFMMIAFIILIIAALLLAWYFHAKFKQSM